MNKKSFIRRIEVQVGIILGVIMFSVLGVFLGIRKGGQKHNEAVVVTKIEDESADLLTLKTQEPAQAGAQSVEEQAKTKEGAGPQAAETTLAQEAVSSVVHETSPAPTDEKPTLAERQIVTEAPPSAEPTVSLPTTHAVKPNENLSTIAKRYYGDNSKWTLIYEANRLSNQHSLRVGQNLIIPSPNAVAPQAPKVEKQIVRVSTAKTRKVSSGRAHRVQQGDTLYKLARTYYGDESQWRKIYNANQDIFGEKEAMDPGDVLIIP